MSDPKRLLASGGLGRVLLESAREPARGPDDAQQEAMWARLAVELPGIGVAAGVAGAATETARVAAGRAAGAGAKSATAWAAGGKALATKVATVGVGSAKAMLAGLVVCAVAGAGVVAVKRASPVVAPVVAVAHEGAPPAAVRPEAPPAPALPPLAPERVPETPAVTLPSPPAPVLAEPAAPSRRVEARAAHVGAGPSAPVVRKPSPMRTEAQLLLDSRADLRARDCDTALTRLAEARQRFARGPLAEEREVLGIKALECGGRSEEADAARASFARAYPMSAYDVRRPGGVP